MNGAADNDEAEQDRLWRKEQRGRLLAARKAMPPTDHQISTGAILLTLSDLIQSIGPKIIGSYWAVQQELDCRPVLTEAYDSGARLALPVVVAKGAPLEFREWMPGARLETGAMNIPYPAARVLLNPDCLVIALVGFDARNYRLGYGGGYYDRTLAAMNPKPVAIGVGFEIQRLDDIRPHEFDLPLDYVVTEAGVQTGH